MKLNCFFFRLIFQWLTDQKRRKLLNKNVDLRKRIELIQDFNMPDSCNTIRMTPDYQFIIAAGTYKPRVKCYEVNNLSTKFERCFDSEVVATEVLNDDYSKMIFLQCDRYIEFHAAHGRHYRLRIPRFGYDLKYHRPSCDVFVVGSSSEIYRLNLERGQFMQSLQTNSTSSVNRCDVNPEHHLLCVGTQEGTVEAWDPRDRTRCGILDVAMNVTKFKMFPSVTAMKFKNGLQLGVGTQSGHVLVFDIRARQPLIVKDHLNQFPIKQIDFNPSQNAVYSMDTGIFKVWDETSGKQTAYIETESSFNDFCTIPNTGMFFFAQEDVKMLTYYIPDMGPAPRWCAFLDNLTEEIESEVSFHFIVSRSRVIPSFFIFQNISNIYDDYKFVTKQELAELGLEHLEGSNLLRAYMHGFFVDIRLYNKARAAIEPFAFEKYRKEKIRQQIEASRPTRLKIKSNLPAVNQELALKIMDSEQSRTSKKTANLLKDDRFKALFENPEFEVDKNADEYKMLTPVLSRLDKGKVKDLKRKAQAAMAYANEDETAKSSDDDLFSEHSDNEQSSDEDDRAWTKDLKKNYRQIRKETKLQNQQPNDDENDGDDKEVDEDVGENHFDKLPSNSNGRMKPNLEFKVKNLRTKTNK